MSGTPLRTPTSGMTRAPQKQSTPPPQIEFLVWSASPPLEESLLTASHRDPGVHGRLRTGSDEFCKGCPRLLCWGLQQRRACRTPQLLRLHYVADTHTVTGMQLSQQDTSGIKVIYPLAP